MELTCQSGLVPPSVSLALPPSPVGGWDGVAVSPSPACGIPYLYEVTGGWRRRGVQQWCLRPRGAGCQCSAGDQRVRNGGRGGGMRCGLRTQAKFSILVSQYLSKHSSTMGYWFLRGAGGSLMDYGWHLISHSESLSSTLTFNYPVGAGLGWRLY